MGITYQSLEKLLVKRGFIIRRVYAIDDACVYIDIISTHTADSFLLYIPSRYTIPPPRDVDVFILKYMEVTEDGSIPGEYAGNPDNFDMEKIYEQIDLEFTGDLHESIDKKLEENYKQALSLKDLKQTDINEIREVFRQLRRLRFCVQNMKYKVCILFKNFLCCIRRDDSFEGFIISKFSDTSDRKLLVTIDLESLHEKIETLSVDFATIKEGIYKVLEKNQGKHLTAIQRMLEHKGNIVEYSQIIERKKQEYFAYLSRFEELLQNVIEIEQIKAEKLRDIQEKQSVTAGKGIQSDIQRIHQIKPHEDALKQLTLIKQELMQAIVSVRAKYENIALITDKVFFDNTVMMNAIVRNILSLHMV